MAALAGEPVAAADEDRFSVRPLDDRLPLDSLLMVATHNSYHLEPDAVRRLLIGIAEPEEPAKLRYSHQTLWEQLENGIRSFELDIRARRNRFTITHVPLVDNLGPNPDLALALREIVLWSERRPGHVPLIVLLELKSDWMFLDPGLLRWDATALERLDSLVEAAIPPDRLLTPAMVRRDADSVLDGLASHGWPTLGESRDRLIVVVHTSSRIDPIYVAGDPTLIKRPMFTSRPGVLAPDTTRADAAFVIHNNPDAAAIGALRAQGLIVRTRADGDGSATPQQRAAALASRAQIVSTDLPPGHPNDALLGIAEFAPGRTLMQERPDGPQSRQ